MMNWIRSNWCKNMHTEAMWPMHGKYICRKCLQEFPVAWEGRPTADDYSAVALHHAAETVSYASQHRVSA
jgi:hypothetical protein